MKKQKRLVRGLVSNYLFLWGSLQKNDTNTINDKKLKTWKELHSEPKHFKIGATEFSHSADAPAGGFNEAEAKPRHLRDWRRIATLWTKGFTVYQGFNIL